MSKKPRIPCAICDEESTSVTYIRVKERMFLIPACDAHSDETREEKPAMQEAGGVFFKYNPSRILEVIPTKEKIPQIPTRKVESPTPPDADSEIDPEVVTSSPDDWTYTERVGHWTNHKGEEVKISSLSKKEFVDAVLALTKANFSRITARVAWTKKLKPEGAPVMYPSKALKVGIRLAAEKLEDFKEVAERKGWA